MEKTYSKMQPGPVGEAAAESILTWKVHLLRENPVKALLILPVLTLSLLVCYIIFHNVLGMAVTLFLITSSFADFLFPVRYDITRQGASAKTLLGRTVIEWNRVKKYYLDDHGIKLSPLHRQTRLEAYRGVYLRFGGRRDEVIEAVRSMRDVVRGNAADGRAAQR
jgi:hypothetical protein